MTIIKFNIRFFQVTQQITIDIHGVGLSLVNNVKQFDLMYIGIASSSKLTFCILCFN